jgi:predicted nucleotidyltransferase
MKLDSDTLDSLDAYLTAIEQDKDINIIVAWVMGSHAHGVADSESDIDVRYVFVEDRFNYISLSKRTKSRRYTGETIEQGVPFGDVMRDTDIEFMGWNVNRFLGLLGGREDGNNPSAIECLASPYTLRTHPAIPELKEYVESHYNVIELFNHYRGFAKKNWYRYIESGRDPTAKRMLYVLRAVLFGEYVRHVKRIPPLDLRAFLAHAPESVLDGIRTETVEELIDLKTSGKGDEPIETERYAEFVESFITQTIDYPALVREETLDKSELDRYFERIINTA